MINRAIKVGFQILMFLILTCRVDIYAQNNTSSPFSIFGIGEIETRDFGRTTGMGNVGIGVKSTNFLNRCNPAGLSGIDTLAFIFDVSAAIKMSKFWTATQEDRATDFNFKNVSVGVRLAKRWTSSVGLSPFSNVGYNLKGTQPIEGTYDGTVTSYFTGTGGINKFYWANAVEIFRGFSLGVTSSYIFGTITHQEEMPVMIIKDTYSVNKIYFDFGLQYSRPIGQYTTVTVGGVYGYGTEVAMSKNETIASGSTTLRKQTLPDTKTHIPEFYGAGFSVTRNQGNQEWLFAADYRYQNWSVDKARHKALKYTDSRVYSVGLQLVPNSKRPENYLQFMRYQIGACYNQSYLTINGYQLDDYSVSAGVGLPFRNRSYVNVAVNFGQSYTGRKGGITERYVLLSVNLSLVELWFAKQQYD